MELFLFCFKFQNETSYFETTSFDVSYENYLSALILNSFEDEIVGYFGVVVSRFAELCGVLVDSSFFVYSNPPPPPPSWLVGNLVDLVEIEAVPEGCPALLGWPLISPLTDATQSSSSWIIIVPGSRLKHCIIQSIHYPWDSWAHPDSHTRKPRIWGTHFGFLAVLSVHNKDSSTLQWCHCLSPSSNNSPDIVSRILDTFLYQLFCYWNKFWCMRVFVLWMKFNILYIWCCTGKIFGL